MTLAGQRRAGRGSAPARPHHQHTKVWDRGESRALGYAGLKEVEARQGLGTKCFVLQRKRMKWYQAPRRRPAGAPKRIWERGAHRAGDTLEASNRHPKRGAVLGRKKTRRRNKRGLNKRSKYVRVQERPSRWRPGRRRQQHALLEFTVQGGGKACVAARQSSGVRQ